jgi:hypothetical protein
MSKCVKVRRDYEKIWQLNKRVIYLFWSSAETKFVSETISLEKKKKEITKGLEWPLNTIKRHTN